MKINFSFQALGTVLALSCVALSLPATAEEVLTYGVDPVPNSQYWGGQYVTGYGLDPVPSTLLAAETYTRKYGQDPIPDAQIYNRSFNVSPQFLGEQRLTRSAESRSGATRAVPYGPRAYRRGR